MSGSLKTMALGYLEDAPVEWQSFADELSPRLAQLLEDGWDIRARTLDNVNLFRTLLLSPEIVRAVGKADTSRTAELLSFLLLEAAESRPSEEDRANSDANEPDILEEIVDVDSDGAFVYRFDVQDDNDLQGADRAVSIVGAGELLNETHLRRVIVSVLNQRPKQRPAVLLPTVRLDVIDEALYKALVGHPELLHSLDWRVFEKLLANILERMGYEVELQRGTKDGGIDIFAVRRMDPFGPHRYLLQAKRWKNHVDVDPVRQLAFLHSHHRMSKSCLATTSRFTRGAWELAKQYEWQLELRDHDGILDWLRAVQARGER